MREIKFRAWDKFRKVMVHVDRIDFSSGFNNKPAVFLYDEHYSGWIHHHDDYELMQYTGLQDKNGKKIYEGDILKMQYQEHHIAAIEFIGHGFLIKGQFNYVPVQEMCEVIGNIHENPELLSETGSRA